MDIANPKIIDAVIDKANKVYPQAFALIGIFGSVATGDDYEKSNLDLLIPVEDEEGCAIGAVFILC